MIKKLVNNTTIMTRLVFSLICVSLIPLLVVGIVSYMKYVNTIINQTVMNRSQNLKQLSQNIVFFMKDLGNLSMQVFLDEDLQRIYSDEDLSSNFPSCNALKRKFNEKFLTLRKGISAIVFYPEEGIPIGVGSSMIHGDYNYKELEIYRKATDALPGNPVWAGTHINTGVTSADSLVISHARAVYKMKGYIRRLGVVEIQINETELESIYKEAYHDFYKEGKGFVIITDKNGNVVSHPEKELLTKPLPFSLNSSIDNKMSGHFMENINGQKYLITFQTLKETGWVILDFTSYENLTESTNAIKNFTIFIAILCIVAAVVFSILLSLGIVKPIRRIIRLMARVENGDLDINMDTEREDEVGQLSRSFVNMTGKIKHLLHDVAQKEIQKRDAEIAALQAQITPHFLYNTLNSIKCLAAIHKIFDIEKMCSSLIKLLKINVDRTGFVKLEDELTCVHEYVALQKFRHGDNFKLIIDVDDELLKMMVPKLILQPIVENYFIHGIDPLCSSGCISVNGSITNDVIELSIKDNGVGMSEEIANSILAEDVDDNSRKKIGLKNVDERIKLYYGHQFGLKIESIPGEGTEVKLRFPSVSIQEDMQ